MGDVAYSGEMRLHDFPHEIGWAQASETRTVRGQSTSFADRVDVDCLIQTTYENVRDDAGDVLVPVTKAHLCADIGAKTSDRFTVDGVEIECRGIVDRPGYQCLVLGEMPK